MTFSALKEVMEIGGLTGTRLFSLCSDEQSPAISTAVHLRKALNPVAATQPNVTPKIEFQDKLFYIYTSGSSLDVIS